MSKDISKRYTKVPNGYLMVLRMDDNMFDELEKFANQEKIPSANFTGMGFVDVTFGFFDFQTKEYTPKEFKKVELASMHGTIAWKDGKPSIHSHGVCGDKSFQAYAGHILSATVGTGSLEIMIVVHDKPSNEKRMKQLAQMYYNLNNRQQDLSQIPAPFFSHQVKTLNKTRVHVEKVPQLFYKSLILKL